jgi:hypothetical protein
MEFKSSQFDMTDPFARHEHLAKVVERHWLAMPKARQQTILADYLSPVTTTQTKWVETPLQTRPFPVETWQPASAAPVSQPTVICRPRRIRRPLAKREWLLLVAMRLASELRRSARKQIFHTLKTSRRFLRRTLRRHLARRGF